MIVIIRSYQSYESSVKCEESLVSLLLKSDVSKPPDKLDGVEAVVVVEWCAVLALERHTSHILHLEQHGWR